MLPCRFEFFIIRKLFMNSIKGKISLTLLIICMFTLLAANAPAQTGEAAGSAAKQAIFKVGVSRRDITPREPVPMWGYGDRHDMLSQGTLDPLYAAAVVLQAGDK